jgi:hypothetical protein
MRSPKLVCRLAGLTLAFFLTVGCSVPTAEEAPVEADLTTGRNVYDVTVIDVAEQFGDDMWSDLVTANAAHRDIPAVTRQNAKTYCTSHGLFHKNFFEFLTAELESQPSLDVAELRQSVDARAKALAQREFKLMRAADVVDWGRLYAVKENRPRLRKYFEAFEYRATTRGFMQARAAGRYLMGTNAEVWARVRREHTELGSRALVPVQFASAPTEADIQLTFGITGTLKQRGPSAPDTFAQAPRGLAGNRAFEPLLDLAKKAGIVERYYFEAAGRTTLVLVDSLQQAWGFEIGEPDEDYPSFRTLSGTSPE